MVDTYSHSHEVVIGSVHFDAFTCTLYNKLTCTSINSGLVFDQSIIPPASSVKENVKFADGVNFASFYEPENYLIATTF